MARKTTIRELVALNKNSFNVKFKMSDYLDICPQEDLDMEISEDIINIEHYGESDLCVWKRIRPSLEDLTDDYKEKEVTRILKKGAWVIIKDDLIWLPPTYYGFLQYGTTDGEALEFRLKKLKEVYFRIKARNNPRCAGTYILKNRQDGTTTYAMWEAMWEIANMGTGNIGIQSKTREDAFRTDWRTLLAHFNGIPRWLHRALFPDYASGNNTAEKLIFNREADEEKNESGRSIMVTYVASRANALDGWNNVRRVVMDEVNKWEECSAMDAFINYKKFIKPGFERRGLFDMFSSPADFQCKSNEEMYELWKDSDPKELQEDGTTKSGIYRYYSNPLEGIQGAYDKWGDADPDMIYKHIMAERMKLPKHKRMGEVRAFPLTEEEAFGSFDSKNIWSNTEGIMERKTFLIGNRFKSEATKEPSVVYGNLVWKNGESDTEVEFRMKDLDDFDNDEARFCFSYFPEKSKLQNPKIPPKIIDSVIGVDPYNFRYSAKSASGGSMGAAVQYRFRNILDDNFIKRPEMLYYARPQHQDTFHEDMLKAAVFTKSLLQIESKSDKLANFMEDRGYERWMLIARGERDGARRYGDAPTGKSRLLSEMIGLIDAVTNIPVEPNEPYPLQHFWFSHLLTDMLTFNPKDTEKNDLTMAFGQALLGAVKIQHRMVRKDPKFNAETLDYLLT